MRFTTRTRILVVPAAVALGASLFAVSLTWQVPAASAAAVQGQARELVRLMNGARAASNKAPLAIDLFLESKAVDGAIPCPDDAAKTIAGRTKDFATYGKMSHNLRLCNAATYTESGTTFVSVMQSWGYGGVGEILGLNGGYGTGAYLYTFKTWQTWTYGTTGHMMLGWQSSSSHWGIVMGSYDRVGCGGWAVGSTFFYACEFARGGPSPSGLVGAPANSPFPGMALPTPKPTAPPAPPMTAPPAAGATPYAGPTSAGGYSGGGYGGGYAGKGGLGEDDGLGLPAASPGVVSPVVTPTPVAEALPIADASATPGGAGLNEGSNDMMSTSGASSVPTVVARSIALVVGSVAGLLSALLALLSMRRRRRETAL